MLRSRRSWWARGDPGTTTALAHQPTHQPPPLTPGDLSKQIHFKVCKFNQKKVSKLHRTNERVSEHDAHTHTLSGTLQPSRTNLDQYKSSHSATALLGSGQPTEWNWWILKSNDWDQAIHNSVQFKIQWLTWEPTKPNHTILCL